MLQAGRSRNAGGYRFGYQGQEADNKIGGLGQHLNYTFRNYDSWAIRFGAIDPLAGKYINRETKTK
jgi:RHS repeat-associated protein